MAIAWMYREDDDRAGYMVLLRGKTRVPFLILETLLPTITLAAFSIMKFRTGPVAIYCAGSLLGV